MYCGLQEVTDDYWNFMPCETCMMNVTDKPEDCHYYFEDYEAFNENYKNTGEQYDNEKHHKIINGLV